MRGPDAVIVGCGPAGSTAAYCLARKGLRVVILDKEKFPRYKSCGGCISTKIDRIPDPGIKAMVDAGVVERTIYGATFSFKSARFIDIVSLRPIGYNVRRDVFDGFLKERAEGAGAEFLGGRRVSGVEDDGSHVTLSCEGGERFRSKFAVFADGAGGVGRRYFGLDKKQCAISITAEVPCEPLRSEKMDGKLFIDFGSVPSGYGWIFPKNGFLSIGVAGDSTRVRGKLMGCFESFISTHRALKDLRVTERVGWTIPFYYKSGIEAVRGRTLAVGDAGSVVAPFLGEGIYYAIASATEAADAIAASLERGDADLSPYQRWLERELYPGFSYLASLSDLVYNHPRLWYRFVEKDPDIMLKFYDVIRGEEGAGDYYRWLFSKVKEKPWQVIRGWLETRFV